MGERVIAAALLALAGCRSQPTAPPAVDDAPPRSEPLVPKSDPPPPETSPEAPEPACPPGASTYEPPPTPCLTQDSPVPGAVLAPSIEFEGSEVADASLPVLDQLAALLTANPWITRLEIRVHENSGREPYGVNLTRNRARRLRALLVERGIDEVRLEAHGYGEEMPLVPASSPDAPRLNERVEFEITAVDD